MLRELSELDLMLDTCCLPIFTGLVGAGAQGCLGCLGPHCSQCMCCWDLVGHLPHTPPSINNHGPVTLAPQHRTLTCNPQPSSLAARPSAASS